MLAPFERQPEQQPRQPHWARLASRGEQAARDGEKQLAMVRVDQVEMMDQLVGQLVVRAIHYFDTKAVDVPVHRELERGDGRLRQLVVRRVRREVHRGEVDNQHAAVAVAENARVGGVARRHGPVPFPGPEGEQESEREAATSCHGGEL